VAALRHYLDGEVAAGNLVIGDTEVVAAQFLDSCHSTKRCSSTRAARRARSGSITWLASRSAPSLRPIGLPPLTDRPEANCFLKGKQSGNAILCWAKQTKVDWHYIDRGQAGSERLHREF
jgi:hypothetical protein